MPLTSQPRVSQGWPGHCAGKHPAATPGRGLGSCVFSPVNGSTSNNSDNRNDLLTIVFIVAIVVPAFQCIRGGCFTYLGLGVWRFRAEGSWCGWIVEETLYVP